MENPEYVVIDGTKYKINTDYRVALKCNEIAQEDGDERERALTILYLLFGDAGIDNTSHQERLLKSALKYLSCGVEAKEGKQEEPDMDIKQDWKYIVASFRSDYGIDIDKEKMHWWTFYSLLCGLTNESVLNRVREIRTIDLKEYKEPKQKEKIKKLQEFYSLKRKPVEMTEEQRRSVEKFYELTGIERK